MVGCLSSGALGSEGEKVSVRSRRENKVRRLHRRAVGAGQGSEGSQGRELGSEPSERPSRLVERPHCLPQLANTCTPAARSRCVCGGVLIVSKYRCIVCKRVT